jgi:polyisoprenoid-binding protein YceI
MKQLLLLILPIFLFHGLNAQSRYYTKTGEISFFSKSRIENIEATNKSVTCVIDVLSGNVQFAVLMRGFEFRKALMQEHFNENYVESDKFPRSEFKGKILNNDEIEYKSDGSYSVHVTGTLTIHGVTQMIEVIGKVNVIEGKINILVDFNIRLSDYKISIPNLVKENISNTIAIRVNCTLQQLN